ncbi:MAG: TonB-dependent receptor [Lysobacterales bacterium]
MTPPTRLLPRAGAIALVLMQTAVAAPTPDDSDLIELNPIQVTATHQPEPIDAIPASMTVISGDELIRRGANDLRTALSLAAGVDVAPGGDGGPAASVPALWGLREFDAFLLVVDGVPWGGAFNPALASVSLTDVERIEVLRGSAPVMFGATSFVGVIHVIHYPAGESGRSVRVSGGTFGTATAAGSVSLPEGDSWRHSLAFDAERRRFADDRAGVDRGHVLYRGATEAAGGSLRFDLDVSRLRQNPNSPHLREGPGLAPDLPLDANYNPSDAKLDEDRYQFAAGYDRDIAGAQWSTLAAFTSTSNDIVRGFIDEEYVDDGSSPNAFGFSQDRDIRDFYLDSHVVQSLGENLQLTWGIDYLHGKAEQTSNNFDYYVAYDGSGAPDSSSLPVAERFAVEDRRNFYGAYLQADWKLAANLDLLAGIRLNRTEESRDSEGMDEAEGVEEADSDRLEKTRPSGSIGLNWRTWESGRDFLALYADYRNTFKPAAIDFGPESEAEILQPETAESWEVGLKAELLDGHFDVDLSVFDMRMKNLVVTQSVNGRPGLTNAGEEHFRGAEVEARWHLGSDLLLAGTYARHQAKFGNYVQLFGDTPTQLDGHYLEMSPENLASLGVIWHPATGPHGSLTWAYVGDRYMNKRNTALAPSYRTLDASLGYRLAHWDITAGAYNLTDERPPVSESELGESQYYRLPARSYELYVAWLF